jgi:hypothetical protein
VGAVAGPLKTMPKSAALVVVMLRSIFWLLSGSESASLDVAEAYARHLFVSTLGSVTLKPTTRLSPDAGSVPRVQVNTWLAAVMTVPLDSAGAHVTPAGTSMERKIASTGNRCVITTLVAGPAPLSWVIT